MFSYYYVSVLHLCEYSVNGRFSIRVRVRVWHYFIFRDRYIRYHANRMTSLLLSELPFQTKFPCENSRDSAQTRSARDRVSVGMASSKAGAVNPNETFLSQAEDTSYGSVLKEKMVFNIYVHRGGPKAISMTRLSSPVQSMAS